MMIGYYLSGDKRRIALFYTFMERLKILYIGEQSLTLNSCMSVQT